VTEVAAFAAWLGGAILVLADGRRGLALGLAVMATGLAGLALAAGQELTAAAILAGGVAGGALRARSGPDGWGLMQPGSTPRIILTIVTALLALYIGASVATGDGAPMRFGVVATIVLTAGRMLQGSERAAALTAASGLALALAAGATLAPSASFAAAIVAAVIAAGASILPASEPRGA
jgi:hypothetical protein